MLSELRASQYCTCTCVGLIEAINWEAEVPEGNSLHASRRWLDGGNRPESTKHVLGSSACGLMKETLPMLNAEGQFR